MTEPLMDRVPWRGAFEQTLVYAPEKRPGFVAWVTAFSYEDGSVGISFDETMEAENPGFVPPRLEFAEAAGVPVSYCSVEGGSAKQRSYRVYMRSADGANFTETGRCPRREGSFCNVGFADGRIVGFDVPRCNDERTGWSDCIRVRESLDGGATWTDVRRLLKGTAPYLWRVRRLRSGTIVVLASLYGTPWGPGCKRATRNTMLPGESYQSKIQPFFLTSENGRDFSGPHYILPGIGAHEFDFAELPDGRLGLYGHVGGDNAFGENDMVICAQVFRPDCAADLPKAAQLSLERLLAPDGSSYTNGFCACLTAGGKPLAGQEVEFRFNTYWNGDGSVNTTAQAHAPYKLRARTDGEGRAAAAASRYDGQADIHLAYNLDVVYHGGAARPCEGPMMTVLALTPKRKTPYPYDAYFAGGVLYLSPDFVREFPGALEALAALPGDDDTLPGGTLDPAARQRLLACGALRRDGEEYIWIHSVHAPRPLAGVKVMAGGDWYE